MAKRWKHVLLCCSALLLLTCETSSGNTTKCPKRNHEAAKHRTCFKKCRNDLNCKGKHKKCLCDGVCGMSCIKPTLKCQKLKKIPNGRYEINTFNKFGARVRYVCDDGYTLTGASERVCQGDGNWSGLEPTCEIEGKCSEPPVVPHASHDGAKGKKVFPQGTQLRYTCETGYSKDGFYRAMCVSDGKWVGPRMTCSPRVCEHPGDIPNGIRRGNVFIFGSHVFYECEMGFRLEGRSSRLCQANGQWSGALPLCKAVTCPRVLSPQHGWLYAEMYTYGAIMKFGCDAKYRLIGSETRQCMQNGNWSGDLPRCVEIDCGVPGPIYNGYTHFSDESLGTKVGSIVQYSCNADTTTEPRGGNGDKARCMPSGKWDPPPPNCWLSCTVPEIPNGRVNGKEPPRRIPHGESITVSCSSETNNVEGAKPKFVISDRKLQHSKCFNGTWPYLPKCVPAPCSVRPPSVKYAMVRFHSFRHNSRAKYKCYTGYRLVGDDVLRCKQGYWRGKIAHCEEVHCAYPGKLHHGVIRLVGVMSKFPYEPYFKNIGHNEKIEYQCNKYYKLSGAQAATCVDGRWSPNALPKCVEANYVSAHANWKK